MAKKKNWRKAVKDAMYAAALLEAQKKSGDFRPNFLYRWEHVQAVVTTALKLAKLVDADAAVVEAAAWLHDVRKDAKDKHPQEGAAFARQLLPQTTFPKKKIEQVASAIEQHMGLWRDEPLKNLEAQVLWDADKLTKIGVMAAFQWTGAGVNGSKRRVTTADMIERLGSADFRSKTIASMHTKPAKKAAKRRFEAYDALVDGLSAEFNATDLK